MRCEWKAVNASEYCSGVTDGTHDSPKQSKTGKYLITSKHLGEHELNFANAYKISEEDYEKVIARSKVEQWDILFSMIGTVGRVYQETSEITDYAIKNVGLFRCGRDKQKSDWLKYYLKSEKSQEYIHSHLRGSTQGYIPLGALRDMPVDIAPRPIQNIITSTLNALDNKIANNTAINHHLEQIAQAIYKSWFVEFEPWGGERPTNWTIGKAEDFFDISIGKTPPRKEPQWFTINPQDIVWVSISDMGSCGVFISDGSEYLTAESVKHFNVKVVPSGTVLLSFKLTVGRVSIANGGMTTNEAIAHFVQNDDISKEYLYCYLKAFDYQALGNTSSIATAVNSKTIKAMPFVRPDDGTLHKFHTATAPLFERIRTNLEESTRLATLRDTLLPRLMSGELSVADLGGK